MNSKKWSIVVILAAVLAVSVLPQAAAAESGLTERTAYAYFERFDDSGCTFTGVSTGGSSSKERNRAYVYVARFNTCTGEYLIEAQGETTNARVDINKKLSRGSIVATIDAFDNVSGSPLTLNLNVAWTGTGVLIESGNLEQSREATAAGRVKGGSLNLKLKQPILAELAAR